MAGFVTVDSAGGPQACARDLVALVSKLCEEAIANKHDFHWTVKAGRTVKAGTKELEPIDGYANWDHDGSAEIHITIGPRKAS